MVANDQPTTSFKWRFDNFMSQILQLPAGVQLESPDFALKHVKGSNFHLVFVPRPEDSTGSASLWLIADELGSTKSIHVEAEFWLEQAGGAKFGIKKGDFAFDENSLFFGFEKYITRSELDKFNASCGKKGVTYLCCKVTSIIQEEPKSTLPEKVETPSFEKKQAPSVEKKQSPSPMKAETPPSFEKKQAVVPIPQIVIEKQESVTPLPVDNLRVDLWELYCQGIHDTILEVGEVQFKVLKCILMAQSHAFKKKLETTMGKQVLINLGPINVAIAQKFIEWFYIGKLFATGSVLDDLYELASTYEVPKLKEECISLMAANLNFDDVYIRYQFAIKNNEDRLVDATTSFIKHIIGHNSND
jgi:hypothetical protein